MTTFSGPTRDLKEELLNASYEANADEKRMILQLHDLLSQIFVLDPAHRITVEQALRHPFIIS
jgi:elongation factor P--beta-lysine ligase